MEEGFGAVEPYLVFAPLKGWGVGVVVDDLAEFGAGGFGLSGGGIELGELDAGAGVGVVFEDAFPGGESLIGLAERGVGLGEGHEGVAVVVVGVGGAGLFEEGKGFVGAFLAEEALPVMGEGIGVLGVAFEGGPVAGLGLGEFALLEVDVAQLGVVMGLVEVVDLVLELLDAPTVAGAWEFESADRGCRLPVDEEEVENGVEEREDDDEQHPEPLLAPDGVDDHPQGE